MAPKFKNGDKIVCLFNNELYGKNIFELEIGKIYTVIEYNNDYNSIRLLNEDPVKESLGYSIDRFINLKEYRKQKLEKLCLK